MWMEAQKRDLGDAEARSLEIRYHLQDHDRDGGKMVAPDLPFKPLDGSANPPQVR